MKKDLPNRMLGRFFLYSECHLGMNLHHAWHTAHTAHIRLS